MKHIITALIIIGFFATFHNTSDQTLICRLAWVDHDFNYPLPVEMMVGELDPGEKLRNSTAYGSGTWTIMWHGLHDNDYEFMRIINIKPKIVGIVSEPGKEVVYHEGI